MKDGYSDFFNHFNISEKKFIEYGLKSIIIVDKNIARKNWEQLKNSIVNNKDVFIRGYGRDAKGTNLYFELYNELFGNNNVKKDPTNNAEPRRIIQELTGVKRDRDILNYQVSHVFGRTKNPYMFTAAWNIIYIPKIFDPFTGHESKGELTEKFTEALQSKIYDEFIDIIEEYNELISKIDLEFALSKLKKKIEIEEREFIKFQNDCKNEFAQINIKKVKNDMKIVRAEKIILNNINNDEKSIGELYEEYKIAAYKDKFKNKKFVFGVLEELKKHNKITEEVISNLEKKEFCKEKFKISFKVIIETETNENEERYYSNDRFEFKGKKYLVCSEWNYRNIEKLYEWSLQKSTIV